ncbi:MAG: DNA-binding transcriptional regulator OxyR [SAR324 cluster bacterium]|uniref:DNA-binding transcriptional regulator OxyR n=1 Tax=SAR324 cluster bacterium TaxID=2024889 RepID=A0A2A4T419_9DELT|nr:MAG: DNA-binding transcriptional regulator OxyR [SAR324 cluster bacterium]
MLFTLSQLEYIVAVDTYRSFSRAARHCFITQPTLSMQIQKMEDLLEVTLFDRSRQPILPTEIGRKIVDQAKLILQESIRLEEIATMEKGEVSGEFHLGVIPTIAPYLLPRFLREFQEQYPKVQLTIDELQTSQIIEYLGNDKLDAGILATPLGESKIIEKPLYYESFLAYFPPDHSLLSESVLSIQQLAPNELLLLEEGHCFRDQALQLCHRRSKEQKGMKAIFGTGNLEVLKKLVDQGFGVTLLPELMIEGSESSYEGRLARFESPTPSREISLVYSRTFLKQTIIQAFIEIIKKALPEEMLTKDGKQILSVS